MSRFRAEPAWIYDIKGPKNMIAIKCRYIFVDAGNEGGSYTDDDLSGSDPEEMPEKASSVDSVDSTYEVCNEQR